MIKIQIVDFEFGIGVFKIGVGGFRIEDWEKKKYGQHNNPQFKITNRVF